MITFDNTKIIGIDHGYGNMKTANFCFPTGLIAYDAEPVFTKDMLVWNGKYYLIGEGRKEFLPSKVKDDDYYALTLVSIAMELEKEKLTSGDVFIAAGLPLTWTGAQKAEFRDYLLRYPEVDFTWQKVAYRINIKGAAIYPQGFAAIAPFLEKLKGEGMTLIADIGNGTMNILFMIGDKPMSGKMFTEKCGVYQCVLAVREAFMQKTQREITDYAIEEVLRNGTADIPTADLKIVKAVAAEYVQELFRRLREHGYDENTMKLIVTGGGGCLVEHFGKYNPDRVTILKDISAAAKGYEYMAEKQMKAGIIQ